VTSTLPLIFHTMANLANNLFLTFELVAGADQQAYYYLAILTVLVAALVIVRWSPQHLKQQVSA
jgi:hypothetical protein